MQLICVADTTDKGWEVAGAGLEYFVNFYETRKDLEGRPAPPDKAVTAEMIRSGNARACAQLDAGQLTLASNSFGFTPGFTRKSGKRRSESYSSRNAARRRKLSAAMNGAGRLSRSASPR